MELTYKVEIAGLIRELVVCEVSETTSIAALILFGDVELTEKAAEMLLKVAPEHDIIIAPEAKGIPLAYEMARQQRNISYIVARKGIKLYMKEVFAVEVQSITTRDQQSLYIDAKEAKRMENRRVLIVDDVISTGESVRAVEALVNKAGGTVVGRMAILAEGEAKDRGDIIYLERIPLLNPDGTPQ